MELTQTRRDALRTIGAVGLFGAAGSSTTVAQSGSDGGETSGTGQRSVAYYPSWARYDGYLPSDVPMGKITHLNYAFLKPKRNATVAFGDEWGDQRNLEAFQEMDTGDTSLMLSIGGWSYSEHFSDAALTPPRRYRFAEHAVRMMRRYDFDGIDIDWEYPGGGGASGNTVRDGDVHRFSLLMRALRDRLDAAGVEDGREYELSAALPAMKYRQYEPERLSRTVDFVNVMAYDMAGSWEDRTSHNAPLLSSGADDPTPNVNVVTAMRGWADTAFSRDQLVVGIPFYGQEFRGVQAGGANGLFQPYATAGRNVPYESIVRNYLSDPAVGKHWDNRAGVPYLYKPENGVWISYADETSVAWKTSLAWGAGYGGTMVWELSQDHDERLISEIHRVQQSIGE